MSRFLLITALLICMSMGIAQAAVVPIINPSFEAPELSRATPYTIGEGIVPTGWTVLPSGAFNPGTEICTEYEGAESVWGFNLPAVDGVQTARMYGSGGNGNGTYLYQNTGIQIQAGQSYVMSAWFVAYSTGCQVMMALGESDSPLGEWNPASLVSGSGVIVPNSTWRQQTLACTIPSDSPAIGKYLCVAIRTLQGWVWFDNVIVATPMSVSGSVNLADSVGDLSLCPIKIELSQGGIVKYAQEVTPTTVNPVPYTFGAVVPGTYDVTFTAAQYLTKTLESYDVSSDVTDLNVTLTNGDVDGDDEITSSDLSVQLKNSNQVGN